MDNSQKKGPSRPVGLAMGMLGSIFYSPGRRGVHIFGLPPERMVMVTVVSLLLGAPLAIVVAMAPFWERVGDLTPLKQLNSYVAPATDGMTYQFRMGWVPRLALKRFMIASLSLIELIFLCNFIFLFSRRVRKHALLVWACYDRKKVLQYFAVSGLIFFSLWFVLFYDWRIFSFLNDGGRGRIGGRIDAFIVMAMPIVALLFGHMATIVGLGTCRAAARTLRERWSKPSRQAQPG